MCLYVCTNIFAHIQLRSTDASSYIYDLRVLNPLPICMFYVCTYTCMCLYVFVFLCVQEDIHVHVCNAAWRYVFVRVLQIELCAFFSYLYMCPDMHLHMNTYIHMYVHFYIFLNIHAEYHRIALEDNPVLIRMHICLQRALQPTEIYDCNPQHTLYIGTTP